MGKKKDHIKFSRKNYRHDCPICGISTVSSHHAGRTSVCISCSYRTLSKKFRERKVIKFQ